MSHGYDIWKCHDEAGERAAANEAAFEAACNAAWDEYLDNGSLPDGRDAGDVDELLSELGILDDLLLAKSDDDLLDAAKAIRDARQEIVDGMIRDSVSI